MQTEIACPGSNGDIVLRASGIPFAELPGQSRLFLDYQNDPLSLRKYYPSAVSSHTEIADRIPDILANYTVDRAVLCEALDETNENINAGAKTFENIALLRDVGTVVVVTGQQTGLFTGPLYTIYKALSAVRASECLRSRGFKAVPVFWAASEDNDLAEVSEAYVLGRDAEIERLEIAVSGFGQPVGKVLLGQAISPVIEKLFDELKPTEFSADLRKIIAGSWKQDSGFSEAFERMIAKLLGEYGVIVVDPLNPKLKKLAAPIYEQAIRRADDVVQALVARNLELESAGYEPQVAVDTDYFPLFWHSDEGARLALRKTTDGKYRTKDRSREFTTDELAEIARSEPMRLSPSVVLRPVVQDYLLPTVCYFGGSAEIAYFAQNSEVYRVMERPVTTILHRQSFTVVEAKHSRTMKRYGLEFKDVFKGMEALIPEIVDRYINDGMAKTFAETEERINAELNKLDRALVEFDATLADNLGNRRRKIIYHIGALRNKFRKAQLQRDEMARRQIESMFNALLPRGGLQERTLNVTHFLDQYGPNFIDWIYRSVDLDDNGHRVLYL